MTISEKINQLYTQNDSFIGGDIKLIVGPLGKRFYVHTLDGSKEIKIYNHRDYISIIKKENGKFYISPFISLIPEDVDNGYEGIIYKCISSRRL